MSNTLAVATLDMTDVKTGSKLREYRRGESLGENVCELRSGQYAEHANIADVDTLADEAEVDLHVLRALVLHGVGGGVDHRHCHSRPVWHA
jgi:hypothetical protein